MSDVKLLSRQYANRRNSHLASRASVSLVIAIQALACSVGQAQQTTSTWTGAISGTWQVNGNWYPGNQYPFWSGYVSKFSGAGNGNTVVSLGGLSVASANYNQIGLLFDTPSAASYFIGNGTLTFSQGGFPVRVNPSVVNNQVVTAVIVTDSQSINYTTEAVLNYSPVATLTLGNLTVVPGASGTGSTVYNFRGLGDITVAGAITDNRSGAAPRLTAVANHRAGTLVLSGVNEVSGSFSASDTPQSISVGMGGTVVLDYTSGNTVLTNGTTVTPGRNGSGNLVLKGRATGTTSLTLSSTTRFGQGYSTITVDRNGGDGTTLVLGSDWRGWNSSGGGKMALFDLSSGGEVQVGGTIAGGYSISRGIIRNSVGGSAVMVKGTDGKTYFATNNASGYIVAQTDLITMPTSGSGSFNDNYVVTADTTLTGSGQFAGNTLRIEGTSANQTLNLGGRNWNGAGAILMDGEQNFTVSNYSNLTPGSGVIVMGPGKLTLNGTKTSGDLEKWGPGLLEVTGSHIASSGATWIWGGIYRAASANALCAGVLNMADGVLELGYNFTRALGSSSGQIRAREDAYGTAQGASIGFSAYGGDRTVNLGGAGATATFGTANFVGTRDAKFLLSSPTSDSMVDFQNPLNLNADHQSIDVRNGSAAVDATLSGVLSNGGLIKTGEGTLSLTGNNTYGLGTVLAAGTTVAKHDNAFGTGEITLAGTGLLSWDSDSRMLGNPVALGGGTLGGLYSLTLNGAVSGPGNIVVGYADSSKTLTLGGTNSYSGTTAVNSGTLMVNGTHVGGGSYTVASGATLAGTGTINSATTVSGKLTPGSSGSPIGTLNIASNVTWNGGATASSATDWLFQIGPNTSDILRVTGNFNKGSGSAFRFDFGGATELGVFKLVEWTSNSTFNASDFSSVNVGGGHTAFFQGNGNKLEVVLLEDCASPPTITLGANPTVCQGTTSVNLPYSGTTFSPDQYFIDYSAAANAAGLLDTALTALGGSPLVLTVAADITPGVYTGTVIVVRSGDQCRSRSSPFVLTVNATPATPGAITQSNPSGSSVCSNSIGVIYSIAPVSQAISYTWSVPAGASITAGQGTTQITVDWGTAGSGDVTVNAQSSCGTGMDQTKSVTVNPSVPDAPSATAGTDVSTTGFTANWAVLVGAEGYRLDISTTLDFSGGFLVNNLDKGAATSHTLSGLSPGLTYYYRVRAYNTCGSSANSITIGVQTPGVFAGWDMHELTVAGEGGFGPSPLDPTTRDSRLTVGGLTRGPGLQATGLEASDRVWGATHWSASANASVAISDGDYATFSFQAEAGKQMSFYQISVFDNFYDTTVRGSGLLQYKIDGGAFNDITTVSYASAISNRLGPINLYGIAGLQNVPDGATVTFRLVNYGADVVSKPWFILDYANSTENDFELRGTFCTTPAIYNVTGGGTACSDGVGASVGISGSQSGVRYQLYRDGNPVGLPVAGTGGAISLGSQGVAGTYTVIATRVAGECTASMSGSARVTLLTAPTAPTGLSATPSSSQVVLNWTAPGGTVTGYRVKRVRSGGGASYETLPAGTNVADTSFTDTTALNGNVYYYTVNALNGVCDSDDATAAEAVMPQECPTGLTPTLINPGNKTVNIGNALHHEVSALEWSTFCTAPTMTVSALPVGMDAQDNAFNEIRTLTFTWIPSEGQQGTYPITVTATDDEIPPRSTSTTFLVFVGNSGEAGSGTTNAPASQTNWSVAITSVIVPSSGNATVVWASVHGVQYDLLSSTLPVGGGASWILAAGGVEADGLTASSTVTAAGSMRFYQVVPQGQARTDRGVWGVVRQAIPSAVHLMSPPLVGDRSFADNGEFGQALAAAVGEGTQVHIATDAVPNWTALEKVGGVWRTVVGTQPYNTPLAAGQAFFIQGASGAIPVFSGPVGNVGTQSVSLGVGFNLLGVSEGKGLPASTAFSNASMTPDPIGHNNENLADMIVIQHANGTWRRLVRQTTPSDRWYDMTTRGATSVTLMPGEAYYYIRRTNSTVVGF